MRSLIRLLTAAGVLVPVLAVGCAGGSKSAGSTSNPTNPQPPATAATSVYVLQENAGDPISSILELAANAQGSVAPTAIINSPASTEFYALAVDASGNIYAAGTAGVGLPAAAFEIFVYAAGASGAATPTRTITTVSRVLSLAVDTTGQIYALSQSGLSIFAANATGSATPIRQIPALGVAGGTSTGIDNPTAVALDNQQNIYIDNLTNILVFPSTANGDVAPTRSVSWSGALYGEAIGVAVDSSGNIFATTVCSTSVCNGSSSKIIELTPSSNGSVTPAKVLAVPTSSPSSQITVATGLAIDGAGNLYTQLATGTSAGIGQVNFITSLWVDVFATGSVTPVQISSPAWTNYYYSSLAVN